MPEPVTDYRRHIPNALVVLRVALTILFVALLSLVDFQHDRHAAVPLLWAGVGVFTLAAITDWLDGKLARRWQCITRFGRIMDSFADKALILGAFVMLAGPGFSLWSTTGGLMPTGEPEFRRLYLSGVYPWMAVLILARELLITSLRGLVEGEGGDFTAIGVGKIKMTVQTLAVPVILAALALSAADPGTIARVVIASSAWGTTIVTALSAIPYIHKTVAFYRQPAPTT